MKYKFFITIFVLVSLGLFFFQTPVASQEQGEENFNLVYDAYKLNLEEYDQAHDDYVLRRAQYLRFGTQKSREDAYEATKTMLQKRDQVTISYLKALGWRLRENEGLDGSLRGDLLVEIQEEVSWYEEHRDDLSSTVTLKDLEKDSDDASSRYSNSTEDMSYKVLSLLSYGKINTFQERLDELLADLREKIEIIKEEEREEYLLPEEKFQTIDRWIIESNRHIARSKEKSDESLDQVFGSKARRGVNLAGYNKMLDTLEESRILLKETITFLRELMRQIKIVEVYE